MSISIKIIHQAIKEASAKLGTTAFYMFYISQHHSTKAPAISIPYHQFNDLRIIITTLFLSIFGGGGRGIGNWEIFGTWIRIRIDGSQRERERDMYIIRK